jgi:hypothetical protein
MILKLDHAQRLNLKQLVGNLPASVDNIRQYWALTDRLDLDTIERGAIEYFEQTGPPPELRRTAAWNPQKRLPPKEFELTPFELEVIRAAIKTAQFISGPSRAWLEGLLDQLAAVPDQKETEDASNGAVRTPAR